MSDGESCAGCGADLDEPPGQPCACGGQLRNLTIHASPAMARAVGFTATVSTWFPAQNPWQCKWLDIQHWLAELEVSYTSETDDAKLRAQVDATLKCCRELADALWEQEATTGLSEDCVKDFMRNNDALKVCDGFAQTSKHNLRDQSKKFDPITAWFWDVRYGRAIVHWYRQDTPDDVKIVDGLDLCRDSVAAWRKYLTHNHLLPW